MEDGGCYKTHPSITKVISVIFIYYLFLSQIATLVVMTLSKNFYENNRLPWQPVSDCKLKVKQITTLLHFSCP